MFINCSSIMGGSSARLVDVGTQLCGTHRTVRIVNKKKTFINGGSLWDTSGNKFPYENLKYFIFPIYSFELQFYFLPFAVCRF